MRMSRTINIVRLSALLKREKVEVKRTMHHIFEHKRIVELGSF
jgi:hypothetical protein